MLLPSTYAQLLREQRSPLAGSEVLTQEQRAFEAVMLGLRERRGLALSVLSPAGELALEQELERGRVTVVDGRARLTHRGRLFADAVARELTG